ncbi:MAG: hypothetical protein P8X57_14255 [Cyclobacteriaceae bacterium]
MKKHMVCLLICLAACEVLVAHPGIGIVSDSEGNVFFTDLEHVWKISTDGELSIAVENVHTHELFIDENDNLYGEHEWYNGERTDTWGNYVWCLKKNGEFEKTIPDVEGFLENNTLVRDPLGNSYWAEDSSGYDQLRITTVDGKENLFSKHKFRDIRWMYYSEDDQHLYVVNNLLIKKVNGKGDVTTVASGLKEKEPSFNGVSDRHYIFGIWTDRNQDLFVAVFGSGKVVRVEKSGNISEIFKSPEGWSPCGGMSANDGTLWILEFSEDNRTRVRKIEASGRQTVFGN